MRVSFVWNDITVFHARNHGSLNRLCNASDNKYCLLILTISIFCCNGCCGLWMMIQEYVHRLDPGTNIGLASDSIAGYTFGSVIRNKRMSTPWSSSWSCNCFDSLSLCIDQSCPWTCGSSISRIWSLSLSHDRKCWSVDLGLQILPALRLLVAFFNVGFCLLRLLHQRSFMQLNN